MAHRARIAVALVAAMFAALLLSTRGFGDAVPIQIHSESTHASFVAPSVASGPQAFVRTRDSGARFAGRTGPSSEGLAGLVALFGSFILVAAAAGAPRRVDRRRTHAPLAVAPSRSPPLTTAA